MFVLLCSERNYKYFRIKYDLIYKIVTHFDPWSRVNEGCYKPRKALRLSRNNLDI